jgi:hypothetical protein
VLLHLAEVEARSLHLRAACPSLYVYCTRVLGMSEDEAFKRIRAARAARRHPVVARAVAEGRLHLIGVVLLAPHLSEENAEELVAEASGKSKAEIEVLLARRAPRPDRPTRLERLAEQMVLGGSSPADPGVAPEPAGRVGGTANVAPLSPARFALQVTISQETQEKLMRAQGHLRHAIPTGDLAEVLDWALDALLAKVEGRKFGKTKAPRTGRKSTDQRYVPRAARREAVARDGMRCAFVSEDGRRCEETAFLELDHVVPVALGGASTADNIRVMCRLHNEYEAERILGRDVVEAGKAARHMDADLVAGLRRLGVTASDARSAVATSRGPGTIGTIEERMRAALAALGTIYADRGRGPRIEEPRRDTG